MKAIHSVQWLDLFDYVSSLLILDTSIVDTGTPLVRTSKGKITF